jgi:hypothetical protein
VRVTRSAHERWTDREVHPSPRATPLRAELVAGSMPRLQILDTFPAFERYWRGVRSESLEVQIDRWEHEYMAPWPQLLEKQKTNYSEEGVDWKRIARSRVFPHLWERLPRMRQLHSNLLNMLPDSWLKTQRTLKLDFPVQFVIYVGIGVGAGWATEYNSQPACLFGLENAAEITSGKDGRYPAAVPHEVAHLAHDEWRKQAGLRGVNNPGGPYWQLYQEGFATECERRIEDARTFRIRTGRADWLSWCSSHRTWLAAKFLRDVKAHRSVRPFFGSWYNIHGQIECGYYLGQEMVRDWTQTATLQEAAVLPEAAVRKKAGATLRGMAVGDAPA